MNTMIYLLVVLFFAGSTDASDAEQEAICSKGKVEVLDTKGQYPYDIQLLLDGTLATTGDCSPTVKLGLLKKNVDTWDTIINISNLGVLMCGFSTHDWHRDTVTANLMDVHSQGYFKKAENIPGTYCFTYMTFIRGRYRIRTTKAFEIAP